MDSLSKLKRGYVRTNNCELDQDVITNLNWEDLIDWCSKVTSMHHNINETSISRSHKTERRDKVLKEIFNN